MSQEADKDVGSGGVAQEPHGAAALAARLSALELQLVEERRRHVAELRAVTLRMERNLELSPLAMLEIDTHSIIRRWNPSAERIFGWSAREAIGRSFFELFVPDLAADVVAEAWQSLLRGEASSVRNANTTKDGRVLVCQWYNTVLRDEDGSVSGVLSQADDITEQERDQQKLRESQELLNAVINNSPTLIFAKDVEGRYILANQRMCEVFNRPLDAILGRRDEELFPEEARERVVMRDREVAQSGQTIEYEEQLPFRDGLRFLSIVKFPLFDEHGVVYGVGGITTDVTERRQLAAERDAMQQQVLQAQQAALRELSTPLIPLVEGVLVMPLIGSIDTTRAAQIMEALLGGVATQRAHTALLDITGVRVVDTHVAHALLQAARAARLLGTQVILTGVRAEVAQALIHLGADLGSLTTMSTLQSGIAHVLRR